MARSGTDLKMAKLLASAAIYVKMGVLYYAFLTKISEHATESLSVILQLKPEKLVCSSNVPTPRDTRASPHIAKDSTVTPVSKSLELSVNVVPASSIVAVERNEEHVYLRFDGSVGGGVVGVGGGAHANVRSFGLFHKIWSPAPSAIASEQNEEWVNAMVDGSDPKMTDGAAPSKSRSVFVQGVSHVLDDVAEVTAVGSKRVSSGPIDVVVALSVGEKGDGSLSSFAVDEEVAANPFGV
ncbi:hypothetical protein Tco_0379009 [Tanacetum coccineum]